MLSLLLTGVCIGWKLKSSARARNWIKQGSPVWDMGILTTRLNACFWSNDFKLFVCLFMHLFIYFERENRTQESSYPLVHSSDACNGPRLGWGQSSSPIWVAWTQLLDPSPLSPRVYSGKKLFFSLSELHQHVSYHYWKESFITFDTTFDFWLRTFR